MGSNPRWPKESAHESLWIADSFGVQIKILAYFCYIFCESERGTWLDSADINIDSGSEQRRMHSSYFHSGFQRNSPAGLSSFSLCRWLEPNLLESQLPIPTLGLGPSKWTKLPGWPSFTNLEVVETRRFWQPVALNRHRQPGFPGGITSWGDLGFIRCWFAS